MKFDLTKRKILLSFSTIFDISCICIISWKTIQSFIKYLENPQGTKVSLEHSQNHQFPTITFCYDGEDGRWNVTHLKYCKIEG